MSRKGIDLTGKRFGKWTVLRWEGYDDHQHYVWRCQCDCGNVRVVRGYSLTCGSSTSCGCGERWMDITGETVGDYMAIKRVGESEGGAVWKCECVYCGNVKEQNVYRFRRGRLATCPVCSSGLTAEEARLKRAEQEQADELEREARKPKKKKTLPLAAICAAARAKQMSYGQYMVRYESEVAQGKLP